MGSNGRVTHSTCAVEQQVPQTAHEQCKPRTAKIQTFFFARALAPSPIAGKPIHHALVPKHKDQPVKHLASLTMQLWPPNAIATN